MGSRIWDLGQRQTVLSSAGTTATCFREAAGPIYVNERNLLLLSVKKYQVKACTDDMSPYIKQS